MEALFNALSQYIDYLVLGAVAFAALSAPFGLRPLTNGWRELSLLVRDSNAFVQVGLISGVLFALFYFSGYLLNAIGDAFLYPAHISIIDTVATFDPNKKDDTFLGFKRDDTSFLRLPVVFQRVIPVFGPLLPGPTKDELKNYWRDANRQIFWEVCDKTSGDDLLLGSPIKKLRLLRGTIGLTQILLVICFFVFLLNIIFLLNTIFDFVLRTRHLRTDARFIFIAHKILSARLRHLASRLVWPLVTFATAFCIYVFLIIPSYSHEEYDLHLTIWAAFPSDWDKNPDELGDSMHKSLPCRKMEIIAEKPKKSETAASESLSLQSNPPKNH
jgi:hypothetical protein